MVKITLQENTVEKKRTQSFAGLKSGQAFFATWGVFNGFFLLTTGGYLLYFGNGAMSPPTITGPTANTVFEDYVPVDAEIHITYTKSYS